MAGLSVERAVEYRTRERKDFLAMRVLNREDNPEMIISRVLACDYSLPIYVSIPAINSLDGGDYPDMADIRTSDRDMMHLVSLLLKTPELKILDSAFYAETPFFIRHLSECKEWGPELKERVYAHCYTREAEKYTEEARLQPKDSSAREDYILQARFCRQTANFILNGRKPLDVDEITNLTKKVMQREMPKYLGEYGSLNRVAVREAALDQLFYPHAS